MHPLVMIIIILAASQVLTLGYVFHHMHHVHWAEWNNQFRMASEVSLSNKVLAAKMVPLVVLIALLLALLLRVAGVNFPFVV